ncbi:unnamed protein product [Phytophthora fragariaefolia]|uniref:Unnamed protein product n=1 Tax=Phytophthora fragariaefolia TaxID=1490495 RepID=A0A9W6U532_9STRA|nr:unnamed protein product [Phytophthora fragariaefolia]
MGGSKTKSLERLHVGPSGAEMVGTSSYPAGGQMSGGGSRRSAICKIPQQRSTSVVIDAVYKTDVPVAPTTMGGGKNEKKDRALVPTVGGGTAVVQQTVAAILDGELVRRDGERAERYVSTVRPAMAALRYAYKPDESGDGGPGGDEELQTKRTTSETAVPSMTTTTELPEEVATTEEGAQADDCARRTEEGTQADSRARRTEEGATTTSALVEMNEAESMETSPVELGAEPTEETWQANEARVALDKRRRQRSSKENDDANANERIHVNLVQCTEGADDDDVKSKGAKASDGLPTAAMLVGGKQQLVKIDSGARYSVAGTDRMDRGERKRVQAPVTYVEGIGGFLLDVLGVWTFTMVNVYDQTGMIDACIVDGCTNDFLIGVDFLGSF